MTLPSNDKQVGDLGHADDHNSIVNEIMFIKENYFSASVVSLDDFLRKDTASATYYSKTINIKTASVDYTPILEDSGYLIKLDSESPIKFILPDNISTPFPIGTKIDILQINIGQVTASPNIGVTLNGNPGTTISGQWAAASLVKLDTDSWVIIGSIE